MKKNIEYYEGHKISYAHGYQEVYMPSHPRARSGGNVYVHDIVAEQIVGRPLLPNEVVHHIDENKQNNTKDNLMVFDSYASHTTYHHLLKNNFENDFILYKIENVYHCDTDISLVLDKYAYKSFLQTRTGKEVKIRLTSMKVCPNCGKLMSRKAQLCKNCHDIAQRKVPIPSKQQLKHDLRELKSFVGVGRKYSVSDNAVRKWCKKYDIPTKSSAIKYLTPADWKTL